MIIIGTLAKSEQTVIFSGDYNLQENQVIMQEERPTDKHIASEDGTWILPTPTLDELKAQKLQAIDQWTANKITGGFTSSASGEPVRYDSDKDTQITMQGIALNVNTPLFEQEYPNGCPVRGYTVLGGQGKQVLMLNAEQVLKWCADLSMHIGSCKQAGWAKQEEVKACKTKEQLEAIVLD